MREKLTSNVWVLQTCCQVLLVLLTPCHCWGRCWRRCWRRCPFHCCLLRCLRHHPCHHPTLLFLLLLVGLVLTVFWLLVGLL